MTHSDQAYRTYLIVLQETLDESWQRILDPAVIEMDAAKGSKITVALKDQAALRGLLNTLWNYNLTVLQVCRLDESEAANPLIAQKGDVK